jgi:hypothetical protein
MLRVPDRFGQAFHGCESVSEGSFWAGSGSPLFVHIRTNSEDMWLDFLSLFFIIPPIQRQVRVNHTGTIFTFGRAHELNCIFRSVIITSHYLKER